MRTLILVLLFLVSLGTFAQSRMYVDRSEVSFVSDAPLEHITATNSACEGLLDPETRSFAIKVPITRFQGFNSPLQREHFNENYLVSRTYPDATFAGRIIETIDLNVSGSHVVRAKGPVHDPWCDHGTDRSVQTGGGCRRCPGHYRVRCPS
jgi:hypothetical protein